MLVCGPEELEVRNLIVAGDAGADGIRQAKEIGAVAPISVIGARAVLFQGGQGELGGSTRVSSHAAGDAEETALGEWAGCPLASGVLAHPIVGSIVQFVIGEC